MVGHGHASSPAAEPGFQPALSLWAMLNKSRAVSIDIRFLGFGGIAVYAGMPPHI
jgi:hypothetical protein